MTTQPHYSRLNSELTLWESLELPITIYGVAIALTKQAEKVSECRLTFQISPELYQRIDSEALFNLKPEIRTPLSGRAFQPTPNIQIEASLDSDLLPQLVKHASDAEQAAAYLQHLSQAQPDHPLLSTYSWYALQVKQHQETGEVGYRTLWAYLEPSDITQDGIGPEKLNEAMHKFVNGWTDTDASESAEAVISQAVEQIAQTFEALTNSVSDMTQQVMEETLEEITNAFEELVDSLSDITEESDSEDGILQTIIHFFQSEDWQFQQLPEESTLRLAFQGNHDRFDCYARANEKKQQFIFYSLCPIAAPEEKRPAIAEFLTRANYGMAIGNFELDYTDGEIRYKTSIDVEGDHLSSALIKTLVYTNVTMMDEYLPGIQAVLVGASPATAITMVEQKSTIPVDPEAHDDAVPL